jgi:ribosome-associated translation inhibitor RaiA
MTAREFTEKLAHILEYYDIQAEEDDGFDCTVTITTKANIVKAEATRTNMEAALKACLVQIGAFKNKDFR